jgi:hypothetical protein
MLTGKTLDDGKTFMEVIYKIKKEGIPHSPNISNFSKKIIAECLNINPNERIGL